MTSNIDATKPATGVDQPVKSIRDNFSYAKIEIEELQDNTAPLVSGVLVLPNILTANLPDPTTVPGGMAFDTTLSIQVASDGTNWRRMDTWAIVV